jgi:hypothetical protein
MRSDLADYFIKNQSNSLLKYFNNFYYKKNINNLENLEPNNNTNNLIFDNDVTFLDT